MRMTIAIPSHLSDGALIAEVTRCTRDERHATAQLIAHLAELDARRLYLSEGKSSLFSCPVDVSTSREAAGGRPLRDPLHRERCDARQAEGRAGPLAARDPERRRRGDRRSRARSIEAHSRSKMAVVRRPAKARPVTASDAGSSTTPDTSRPR
jgi:hypothetical protein